MNGEFRVQRFAFSICSGLGLETFAQRNWPE